MQQEMQNLNNEIKRDITKDIYKTLEHENKQRRHYGLRPQRMITKKIIKQTFKRLTLDADPIGADIERNNKKYEWGMYQ